MADKKVNSIVPIGTSGVNFNPTWDADDRRIVVGVQKTGANPPLPAMHIQIAGLTTGIIYYDGVLTEGGPNTSTAVSAEISAYEDSVGVHIDALGIPVGDVLVVISAANG